jgi:hypothetical protein
MEHSFSERFGYNLPSDQPLIREDAPEQLRCHLIGVVTNKMGYSVRHFRSIVCDALLVRPNPNNWSEYPNISDEVEGLIYDAEWYRIYDIIEALANEFLNQGKLKLFVDHINAGFVKLGIGWLLDGTTIVTRGDEVFQATINKAIGRLDTTGFSRAQTELKEAFMDLSRRPQPDLTGTIQHSMGALESVTRELSGNPKATLGEIIKAAPNLIPKPLDTALPMIWGYSSEFARHIREDRSISREEAQLVLGLSSTLILYLMDKQR